MSIIRYASSDSIGTASLCSQGSIGKRTEVEGAKVAGNRRRYTKRNAGCVLLSMLLSSFLSNENTCVRFTASFRQPFVLPYLKARVLNTIPKVCR